MTEEAKTDFVGSMNPVAKVLLTLGAVLVIAGLLWQGVVSLGLKTGIALGRLPGDIVIDRPGMKFYFPMTTCLLISALLSLVGWIVRWFSER